jgi:probable DNA repair protein
MLSRSPMQHAALLDAMRQGATVLTANARLSRSLLNEQARHMQDSGREAWRTPDVLPWNAWLAEAWEEAALLSDSPLDRLLSEEQEAQLWANVIVANDHQLLRPAATARTAQHSWKLLHQWQVGLDEPAFRFHENAQAFRRWALAFRRACAERSVLSVAELEGRLASLCGKGGLAVPARMLLVGFYDLTPAQQELATSLSAAGSNVAWVGMQAARGNVRRVEARDSQHETRLVASWARAVLGEHPRARVGIVLPDLATRRQALERQLAHVLDPARQRPGAAASTRPWNLSLGLPLDSYPVIQTALQLLSLSAGTADIVTLGQLLASPFWAMPAERAGHLPELNRRALLDRRLRSLGDHRMTIGTVGFYAGQESEDGAARPWRSGILHGRLARLAVLQRTLPGSAGSAEWARCLSGWLAEAGWCAGCRLDGSSFQAVERWQRLLSSFSRLDEFSGPLGRAAAVQTLRRLASEVIFQPNSGDAPVQVLGLHEANEQRFDHLWVMNLHDGLGPQAPAPDPFIPLELQRLRTMPGCDPERELQLARLIIDQLAGAAGTVVFSHPATAGDELLSPSPLIMDFEPWQAGEVPRWPGPGWREIILERAVVRPLQEQPLPTPDGQGVTGGSGVLKSQSACPFRAFAEYRLAAWPLDSASLGLGPMRRGSLLHRVMELFWRAMENSERLLGMSEKVLRGQVEEAVAVALEEQRRASPLTVNARYAEIEAGRLGSQVLDWLKLEKQRSPFRVVAFEQEAVVEAGGLRLRVVIDRIDQLADGREVVIDYKTGRTAAAGWFGERPDEPQLPLYSVAQPGSEWAGLAFAQLRADGLKFTGVVSDGDVLPGLPPKGKGPLAEAAERWPAVLSDWSRAVVRLGAEFRAGRADVAPKNGLRTCDSSYCRLAPLCRVRTALPGGEES